MDGSCSMNGRGYWSESQRERPLKKPRCRWVDNIKMDLAEIGCSVDWSGSG
jgi:hypothetical protein